MALESRSLWNIKVDHPLIKMCPLCMMSLRLFLGISPNQADENTYTPMCTPSLDKLDLQLMVYRLSGMPLLRMVTLTSWNILCPEVAFFHRNERLPRSSSPRFIFHRRRRQHHRRRRRDANIYRRERGSCTLAHRSQRAIGYKKFGRSSGKAIYIQSPPCLVSFFCSLSWSQTSISLKSFPKYQLT